MNQRSEKNDVESSDDAQSSTDVRRSSPKSALAPEELDKLGRQRPEAFGTAFAELAFCFALLASMFMAVRVLGYQNVGFGS